MSLPWSVRLSQRRRRKDRVGYPRDQAFGSHFLPGTLLPSNCLPPPSFAPPPALFQYPVSQIARPWPGATPALEHSRWVLRWSQGPGCTGSGVDAGGAGRCTWRSRGDRAGCARAWRVLGREPRGAGDTDATWPARGALGGGRRSKWASDVAR